MDGVGLGGGGRNGGLFLLGVDVRLRELREFFIRGLFFNILNLFSFFHGKIL